MQANSLFSLAARIINHTGQHLFLTGNAGTGKTTFLRYIREHTPKKTVVVAPTGVAAINAGGVTMHSFFHLPFGMYLPEARNYFEEVGGVQVANKNTLFKNVRFRREKILLLRELELLIIDEVSMLRADALDAIDAILRHYRRQPNVPYGGVQVLFIGDLYQLPPVLKNTEARLFFEHYRTPFFFDSLVAQEAPPLVVELKHIYRQQDDSFIRILNAIRNNNAGYDELDLLHERYRPEVQADDGLILLTTHNQKADDTNRKRLEALPSRAYTFGAKIDGDFSEYAYPAEKDLVLKVGAQVMFTKNDSGENRRWYNGKLATVTHIGADGDIWVRPVGAPDRGLSQHEDDIKLELHEWKNVRYSYNEDKDEVEENELGSFKQYPVRLAWAITIHKSQGLTFERAIVDAGQSFAPGQVYVALSRLISLQGLILHSRIAAQGIAMPEAVVEFCQKQRKEESLEALVRQEEEVFAREQLFSWFGMRKLREAVEDLYANLPAKAIPDRNQAIDWASELRAAVVEMEQVAHSFQRKLMPLLDGAPVAGYVLVAERVEAAANWFGEAAQKRLLEPLAAHYKAWSAKPRTKKYLTELASLEAIILQARKGWAQARELARGLAGGAAHHEIQLGQQLEASVLKAAEGSGAKNAPQKGATYAITLEMFKEGKTLEEIAAARSLTSGTIEGHLLRAVQAGNLNITDWIPVEKLDFILKIVAKQSDQPAGAIKAQLPDEITFNEIRAAQYYQGLKKELA